MGGVSIRPMDKPGPGPELVFDSGLSLRGSHPVELAPKVGASLHTMGKSYLLLDGIRLERHIYGKDSNPERNYSGL
jgi:hypothetical protein